MMLRIKSIEVDNFGPYKGRQTIDFGGQDGVIVVYGENMRGKTTLLNAVRFALFGKVLGRAERSIDVTKLLNIEAREEGARSFSTTLLIESEGTEYDIRRTCTLDGVHGEATVDTMVLIDSEPQNQETSRDVLQTLLPEGVSRFFLFDGELLQQYEELLLDESDAGRKISDAIEQILGMPILMNARLDLGEVLHTVRRLETKAGKQNKATETYASQLEVVTGRLDGLRNDERNATAEMHRLVLKREELEALLRRSGKVEALLARRRTLETDLETLRIRRQEGAARISQALEHSWHWPIASALERRRSDLLGNLGDLQRQLDEVDRNALIRTLVSEATKTGKCPICESAVQHAIKGSADDAEDATTVRLALGVLQKSLSAIGELVLDRQAPAAIEMTRQMHGYAMDISRTEDELREVTLQISNAPAKELTDAREAYGRVHHAISQCKNTLGKLNDDINSLEESLRSIQKRLSETGGVSLRRETRRRELVEQLRDIMDAGIGRFRSSLRERVQTDATDLFRKLTTETDYAGLEINESYGLRIMHQSGHPVEVRSSGAEHIVAFSLIGALQRNAPLRGPLFIDSPFGRLDAGHVDNVVAALPDLGKQIVLFVYLKELEPTLAKRQLGAHLLKEYHLRRVSALHTEIERYGG